MSEKMTTITLPGLQGSGFSDYGEVPVAKMIAKVREHAQLQLELAQATLNAADGDNPMTTRNPRADAAMTTRLSCSIALFIALSGCGRASNYPPPIADQRCTFELIPGPSASNPFLPTTTCVPSK